jgi:hypothetical protein
MRSVRFLLAYAPEDAAFADKLRRALVMPIRRKEIVLIDQQMAAMPGADREAIVQEAVASADVALLILSQDFIASEECFALLEQALARRESGQLTVAPLLARNCTWMEIEKLARLQPLPRNGQFIDQQPLFDKALTEAAQELLNLADRLRPALPPLP